MFIYIMVSMSSITILFTHFAENVSGMVQAMASINDKVECKNDCNISSLPSLPPLSLMLSLEMSQAIVIADQLCPSKSIAERRA